MSFFVSPPLFFHEIRYPTHRIRREGERVFYNPSPSVSCGRKRLSSRDVRWKIRADVIGLDCARFLMPTEPCSARLILPSSSSTQHVLTPVLSDGIMCLSGNSQSTLIHIFPAWYSTDVREMLGSMTTAKRFGASLSRSACFCTGPKPESSGSSFHL